MLTSESGASTLSSVPEMKHRGFSTMKLFRCGTFLVLRCRCRVYLSEGSLGSGLEKVFLQEYCFGEAWDLLRLFRNSKDIEILTKT